ncbi:hypothetical protein JQ608_38445 [Bradyrhizobium liaoningense]|uniref:hypothetical protein n=1 Tax=Bradyrhizobium liaoningense TaxID=43992 RepID=UPI001BAB34E3|nr:hypothetical protein [Bradyrhizobium liaoningense]MBR0882905.1 hypothetical protein [Bradyrhizobium liaoningense]
MNERPKYRAIDIAPGLQFFDCTPLRASLSTKACGDRWAAAAPGSACQGCSLGRQHYADHHPGAQAVRRHVDREIGVCVRCGRSDLRLIRSTGVCVSCANREYEFIKGKNAKGRMPVTYEPLHQVEVAVQHQDGAIERRLINVRHAAEAVARVMRDLPIGACFVEERRLTAWNGATSEFEHVCTRCGTQGLILERERRGLLERHHWCCGGDPHGGGWRLATVRTPQLALRVGTVADLLNNDADLADEAPCTWTPTPHPCADCRAGQVQARLLEPGGRWQCRCEVCGTSSERDGQ